ncbi:MAG: hypothetical protein C5B49_13485 [Bdellovibrio sp.]|nr:MAG: hypothetical protein C5B49_13485 [Bdellovibrio sp.]
MMSQYLSLTEYSTKYKVSISTLRRRIKADEIKYRFDEGKYLILDEAPDGNQKVHRPSPNSEKTEIRTAPPKQPSTKKVASPPRGPSADSPSFDCAPVEWNVEFQGFDTRDRQEPILTSANRLLTELKKAYTAILMEKEDQILDLREEISDLKTLVKVLESENAKRKLPCI